MQWLEVPASIHVHRGRIKRKCLKSEQEQSLRAPPCSKWRIFVEQNMGSSSIFPFPTPYMQQWAILPLVTLGFSFSLFLLPLVSDYFLTKAVVSRRVKTADRKWLGTRYPDAFPPFLPLSHWTPAATFYCLHHASIWDSQDLLINAA